MENGFPEVDINIYGINKSLRVPLCPKITNNVMYPEYTLYFEYPETTIDEILFTAPNKPSTLELSKYSQLYLQTNAI